DWVFASSANSWVETENTARDKRDTNCGSGDLPCKGGVERENRADNKGSDVPAKVAKDTTNETHNEGFDHKLPDDISATGTDCFAQANFTGALGNTHKHNIHNADTTDD